MKLAKDLAKFPFIAVIELVKIIIEFFKKEK